MYKTNKVALIFFISLLFMLAFSPYHALMRGDLKADDASYLSHAFTLGLDFNLQYENMVADWKTREGNAAAHPIGPGIMAAPFVALFSMIDRFLQDPVIANHEQYRYSWSLFGFVFSVFVYFISALFLYARALEKLRIPIPRSHFWVLSCSFGLLYYMMFRPVMGHVFEFFTLGLCFYCSAWWIENLHNRNKIHVASLFGIALSSVLTLSIRPADLNIFLLPFIVLLSQCAIDSKKIEIKKVLQSIFVLFIALIVVAVPFMALNQSLYGMVWPTPEMLYGDHITQVPPLQSVMDYINAVFTLIQRLPEIKIISFSSEFGLAFTSAILFYGVLFLLFYLTLAYKKQPSIAVLSLLLSGAYVGFPIAIILFWQSVGDAYGYRFLYGLFPVAMLGYAIWYNVVRIGMKNLQIVLFLLALFGIMSSTFFGLHENLMFKANQPNAFGKGNESAVGYNVAVLRAIPDPNIWINCVATRTPGFYAAGMLHEMNIDINRLSLPTALADKIEKFEQSYQYPPRQVYLQVLLLGMVFIGGSFLFCSPHKKR